MDFWWAPIFSSASNVRFRSNEQGDENLKWKANISTPDLRTLGEKKARGGGQKEHCGCESSCGNGPLPSENLFKQRPFARHLRTTRYIMWWRQLSHFFSVLENSWITLFLSSCELFLYRSDSVIVRIASERDCTCKSYVLIFNFFLIPCTCIVIFQESVD